MAKDPAILFYTSDFLTGTFTMTDEQVGRYIKLLCLQHQKGVLTIKDLEFVCKGKDQEVFDKFEKDENGNYFNATLKERAEERKAYSESRKKNIQNRYKKHTYEHTHVVHMENENEIVNVIENKEENKNLFFPFDSEEFMVIWEAWVQFRIELKKPYQTFSAKQAHLQMLSKHPESVAIEMIKQSMSNEWKDIYTLKNDGKQTNNSKQRASNSKSSVSALVDELRKGHSGD